MNFRRLNQFGCSVGLDFKWILYDKSSNFLLGFLNQLPRESAGCLAGLIFFFEDCMYVPND